MDSLSHALCKSLVKVERLLDCCWYRKFSQCCIFTVIRCRFACLNTEGTVAIPHSLLALSLLPRYVYTGYPYSSQPQRVSEIYRLVTTISYAKSTFLLATSKYSHTMKGLPDHLQITQHAGIRMHLHKGRCSAVDMEPRLWDRIEGEPSGCPDQDLPPGGPLWGEQLHIHAAQRISLQPQVDHAQCAPLCHQPTWCSRKAPVKRFDFTCHLDKALASLVSRVPCVKIWVRLS